MTADETFTHLPARPGTGSHDLPVSPELASFMSTGWAATPLPADTRVPAHAVTPARRARLSALFPGERLLIPAGQLKVRSNDCDHRFRPHSAYAWLTGLTGEDQPGHALVLEPSGPHGHEAVLYLRPRSPRDGDEFYRDRRYGEFWVGRRPDLAETERLTGIRCAHLDGLDRLPPSRDASSDTALATALSELRLVKDAWEVGQLQLAVDHTTDGFEDVVRALPRALSHPRGERHIEESSDCGPGPKATAPATTPSPRPVRTPVSCTGSATTAPSTRPSSCCSTRAWRPTRSTPRTSRALFRCPAASPPCSVRSTNWFSPPRTPGSRPSNRARASGTSTAPVCG